MIISRESLYGFTFLTMEPDGKIDGKFPIFDDILAFIWFKKDICPRDTLLSTVKLFYKATDIAKSRDVLYHRVPESNGRRTKHRNTEDILKGIYTVMQEIPTEDRPKFVAVDLNNLPFIKLNNIDGASLVTQHNAMKENLDAVLAEQQSMRLQLVEIQKLLESRGQVQISAASVQNTPMDAMQESSNAPRHDDVDASQTISSSTATNASEIPSVSTVTYASLTTIQSNDNGPSETRSIANESHRLSTVNSASRVAMTGSRSSQEAMTGSRSSQEAMTGSSSSRIQTTGRGAPRVQMTSRRGSRGQANGRGNSRVTLPGSRSSRVTAAGYDVDNDYDSEDGFTRVTRRRRSNKMQFTGRKTGTVLRSVPRFRKIQVFVSRLEENMSPDAIKNFVNGLINEGCEVEQLRTRYPSYSSFLISCDIRHKDLILNPDEWEEGVLVRRSYDRRNASHGDA